MFTQEELKNLLALIAVAPIKGIEATTVALLQQKITSLVAISEVKKEDGKQD